MTLQMQMALVFSFQFPSKTTNSWNCEFFHTECPSELPRFMVVQSLFLSNLDDLDIFNRLTFDNCVHSVNHCINCRDFSKMTRNLGPGFQVVNPVSYEISDGVQDEHPHWHEACKSSMWLGHHEPVQFVEQESNNFSQNQWVSGEEHSSDCSGWSKTH